MSSTEDEEFTKAFEGFGEEDDNKDKLSAEAPTAAVIDPTTAGEEKKEGKEGKEENAQLPVTPPVEDRKEEEVKPTEAPAEKPEAPSPLTKDDVTAIISNLRNEERNSGREIESTTKEVIEAYYPDGLSNVLVDEKSGKELRVPADVVEVTGGDMTIEEAAQWLMNEQFKLDKEVDNIKNKARDIAETTVKFKRDSVAVIEKYEPLFKAYPHLQQKVYDKLIKQVKVDKDKGVILAAPDVMEHYDDYLEPYQQAFEFANNKPATNPVAPETPAPPKPTTEDRMDISGDAGQTPVDDPNDFAQQVRKELSKGL